MKTIYILIGIVGTGKSTYAKELQGKVGGEILSSDEIRKEFIAKGVIPKNYDSKYNSIVFDEMHRRIEKFAQQGVNIIVDSTNVLSSSRKPIIDIGKKFGYKIQGELLLLSDEECLKRVEFRQKNDVNSHYIADIPKAISIYKERLENGMPTLEEGFHEINTYENGEKIKVQQKVLIASTNAGKIAIYADILDKLGINYCSLRDLQVGIEVDEIGITELDNALIKANAYHEATSLPVISNDSGLVIEKFKPEEQPGVFVRRYGDRELTDQEMIDIFSKKLETVGGESDAYFNVALAIYDKNGEYYTKLFRSDRYMISKPSKVVTKGLPLRSLDYSKKLGKYMSEMTVEEANGIEGECIIEQSEFIKEILQN